jgi:hypothetical protein
LNKNRRRPICLSLAIVGAFLLTLSFMPVPGTGGSDGPQGVGFALLLVGVLLLIYVGGLLCCLVSLLRSERYSFCSLPCLIYYLALSWVTFVRFFSPAVGFDTTDYFKWPSRAPSWLLLIEIGHGYAGMEARNYQLGEPKF